MCLHSQIRHLVFDIEPVVTGLPVKWDAVRSLITVNVRRLVSQSQSCHIKMIQYILTFPPLCPLYLKNATDDVLEKQSLF